MTVGLTRVDCDEGDGSTRGPGSRASRTSGAGLRVEAFRRGERSPLEELRATYDAISRSKLNAFCFLDRESAERDAKNADISLPFGGVPFGVKELDLVAGWPDTEACMVFQDRIATTTDTQVNRVCQIGGAVKVGLTNASEFGGVNLTRTILHGATLNPWQHDRTPGGSSGGSAAAVAADMCLFSVGEDTGGSGRQPASLTGIYSLKPTYARIPRYGCIALSSSLDTVSPMTRTAEDSEIIFNVVRGADGKDQTVHDEIRKQESLELMSLNPKDKSLHGIKFGLPKEYFIEGLSEEVKQVVNNISEKLKSLGAEVKEISLPHTNYGASVYYIVQTAETSSNLNRYDGIRYGYSDMDAKSWDEKISQSREKGFGEEAKRRILLGTFVLSSGYFDAYYIKAQKVRNLIRKDYEKAFEEVDAILSPVAPSAAFKIGENTSDPLQMYLEDVFTIPVNLAGVPSFAIPAGKNPENLPIGVQFIGPHFSDEFLMKIGETLENN